MIFRLIILIVLIITGSCNDDFVDAQLEKKLRVYFSDGMESPEHLDSMRIVAIDTLTKKKLIEYQIRDIVKKTSLTLTEIDNLNQQFESNNRMSTLYEDISPKLYKNYLDDAGKNLSEMNDLLSKSKDYKKQADSLNLIYEKSDSMTPVYFTVRCFLQIQRKNMTIKRDTMGAFLTPDKNIIDYEDVKF